MAAVLMPEGRQSFEDGAGRPLVGGKLYTYTAGTSAPQGTWIDAAQTTTNTNPIILDARGEATIFWSGSYKVVLTDALDAVIWTQDNVVSTDVLVSGPGSPTSVLRADLADTSDITKGDALIGVHRTEAGAVGRTLHFYIQRSKLLMSNFCDPTSDTPAQVAAAFTAAVTAAKNGQKSLEFEPGATYVSNQSFVFLNSGGSKGLRFWGNGCTLRNTSAGIVAALDAGGGGARNDDIEFTDFILRGNAASTYGLFTRGYFGGRIYRTRVVDVATAGYYVGWHVCSHMDSNYLSAAIDTPFPVIPATGFIITHDGSMSNYTADMRITNPIIENPISGLSFDIMHADLGVMIDGGTAESVFRGMRHRSTARRVTVRMMDFEDNADFDILIEGQGLTLEDVNCGSSLVAQGNVLIGATASGTTFRGGYYRQIDIDPASTGTVLLGGTKIDNNPSIGITNSGPYQSYGAQLVDTSVVGAMPVTGPLKDRLGPQNLNLALTMTQGVSLVPTLTVSEGRNRGQYTEISATLTVGAAGTAGLPILVQVPVGYRARSTAVNQPCGYWSFSNGAASGVAVLTASGEIGFMVNGTTSLLGTTGTTAAVGNILRFNVSFTAL